ncbi:MAG: hypothetical protein Fur0014_02870 [Rubrivivax sp.]
MGCPLLIVEPPGPREARGLAGAQEALARLQACAAGLQADGAQAGVNALQRAATRVRRRRGRVPAPDGPVAGTQALIGGHSLSEGVRRERAFGIAADGPSAAWAPVAVRETGTC